MDVRDAKDSSKLFATTADEQTIGVTIESKLCVGVSNEQTIGVTIESKLCVLHVHHNIGKHLMFVEGFRTNGEDDLSLCVGLGFE